ncbi:MAG: biopolymer transporter ExbD [Fibrobacteria bacterium]|nr:biopolymer transporter ExbD [Fibrobacteria bacterium]
MKSLRQNTKQPSNNVDLIDLDVTPIMNMFVILIPFLVSMAVFAHYSVLEFSLPPNAGIGNGGPKKAELKLTVVMRSAGFDLTVGDSLMNTVQMDINSHDYSQLEEALEEVKERLTRKDEVVVAVNDGIKFDKVVQVMDACRNSGYAKVALAEGPNIEETALTEKQNVKNL